MKEETTRRDFRSTTNWSTSLSPPTTDSPSPQSALMSIASRPAMGSTEKPTPAVSQRTILWTTTAIAAPRCPKPLECLYATARSCQSEMKQARILSRISSAPTQFR